MQGTQVLKEPSECSEPELAEFERLVRIGFAGSDLSLPTRVRSANCLAFQFEPEKGAVAIAGLKQPKCESVAEVFAKADCDLVQDEWRVELWMGLRLSEAPKGRDREGSLRTTPRTGGELPNLRNDPS